MIGDELDDRLRSLMAERARPMARWATGAPPRPATSRMDENLRRAEARLAAAEVELATARVLRLVDVEEGAA